jgi:hypothetical protein
MNPPGAVKFSFMGHARHLMYGLCIAAGTSGTLFSIFNEKSGTGSSLDTVSAVAYGAIGTALLVAGFGGTARELRREIK